MLPLEAIKNDKTLFETAVHQITPEILGSIIDHTQLNPTATRADIEKLCDEASQIGSFICIHGSRIVDVQKHIADGHFTAIRGIAAVIGFPHGAELTREKEYGALGVFFDKKADEVDMVLNIGKLLDGNIKYVAEDVRAVAEAVKFTQDQLREKKILKVIQENCYLNAWQKHTASVIIGTIAENVGIHMFAKTSTGFGTPKGDTPKGATLDDVWHMNQNIQQFKDRKVLVGVKAAGGIGDAETAVKMMLAGGCFDDTVTIVSNPPDIFRIGASAGVKIVNDFKEHFC